MRPLLLPHVVSLVLLAAAPLAAQSRPPIGAHNYRVDATFEGEPMFPWMTQMVVTDTVVDGDSAVAVGYNSRDDGAGGWFFTYRTTLRRADQHSAQASWRGRGSRGPTSCDAVVDEGVIRITDPHGEQQSGPHEGTLMPDFALPVAIAMLDLEPGTTLSLTPYRCATDPRGASQIRVWNVDATVTAGTWARPYRGDVPALIVRTTGEHVVQVVVDAADRTVLHVTTQQGHVGESRERYVSSE